MAKWCFWLQIEKFMLPEAGTSERPVYYSGVKYYELNFSRKSLWPGHACDSRAERGLFPHGIVAAVESTSVISLLMHDCY